MARIGKKGASGGAALGEADARAAGRRAGGRARTSAPEAAGASALASTFELSSASALTPVPGLDPSLVPAPMLVPGPAPSPSEPHEHGSHAHSAEDRGRAAVRVELRFGRDACAGPEGGSVVTDMSCVTLAGRSVFCSCDEAATVERLILDAEGRAASEHKRFHLGEIFDLPGGPHGEMDIEGLAVSDNYLWICGSHALKRRKLKTNAAETGLDRLGETRWDENRAFLGRVPLRDLGNGLFEPVALDEGEGEGKDGAVTRRAAMLKLKPGRGAKHSRIRRTLVKDTLIRPFRRLAAKENGIDVEGLAVDGDTVLLGLRGPVVGGHALVARLRVTETKTGRLKLRRLPDGRRAALHALDLDGQGVRDLWWQDGRLIVLSGPATDLEALQSAYLVEPFDPDKPFYGGNDRRAVLHLPVVRGADHAEGIALVAHEAGRHLLVVYDSPHPSRVSLAENSLSCDAFRHD